MASHAPRRQQHAITIRSDHAYARLALLARDGRSQAKLIEEALDRMPLPKAASDTDRARSRIDAIIAQGRGLPKMTMAEFDALEYDEDGNCR